MLKFFTCNCGVYLFFWSHFKITYSIVKFDLFLYIVFNFFSFILFLYFYSCLFMVKNKIKKCNSKKLSFISTFILFSTWFFFFFILFCQLFFFLFLLFSLFFSFFFFLKWSWRDILSILLYTLNIKIVILNIKIDILNIKIDILITNIYYILNNWLVFILLIWYNIFLIFLLYISF